MKHLRTALLTTATVVATATFAQQITLNAYNRDYWKEDKNGAMAKITLFCFTFICSGR